MKSMFNMSKTSPSVIVQQQLLGHPPNGAEFGGLSSEFSEFCCLKIF